MTDRAGKSVVATEFERNPLKLKVLRSSVGYLYGICARRLYYACRDNVIDKSPEEVLQAGKEKHEEIQRTRYPTMQHDKYIERTIPEIAGVSKIGATFDCIDESRIIEIKPTYVSFSSHSSYPSYCQTLVQRFVIPNLPMFVYSYIEDREFPIKADYTMSKIYIGRMLTAIQTLPPRIPDADESKSPCSECLFRKECWSLNSNYDKGTEKSWAQFSELARGNVEKIMEL